MTDSVLSTFIERTHVDPALARDLLDATDWNLEAAVTAYHSLYDTKTVEPEEYQYDLSEFIDAIACTRSIPSLKNEDIQKQVNKNQKIHDVHVLPFQSLITLF